MSICQLPRINIRWDAVLLGLAVVFAVVLLSYTEGKLDGQVMVKRITDNEKMIVLKREARMGR